jgi:hypothetical protein
MAQKVPTSETRFRACVPLWHLCHTRALQRHMPLLWGLARVPTSPDSPVSTTQYVHAHVHVVYVHAHVHAHVMCICMCMCIHVCMCMRMSIRLHYRLGFDMHMSISFGRNSRGTLHYFTALKYGLGPRNGPGRTRTSLVASKRQDTRQVMTPL